MSELPWDLVEEILCHVPAASLKRFRATCKRWDRLFNDKRFRRKHLDKAAKQSQIVVLEKCSIMSRTFSPEKLSLTELHSSLDQTEICGVSHCHGLLLCVTHTGLVVWNPFTGQTRLILKGHHEHTTYALGSYQDKKSNDNISYKILSHRGGSGRNGEFKIYEINSDSWRILDIDFSILGWVDYSSVSLKGKTYWIAQDEEEGHVDKFYLLVSFDYATERFERLCLPDQYPSYLDLYLSVVREEKLCVLLQRDLMSRTEIWVTNRIGDETKVVSWRMVYAVDAGPQFSTMAFWTDEEKKFLVYCDYFLSKGKIIVHNVGEDKKVKQVDFEGGSSEPFFFSYVPSLIQI